MRQIGEVYADRYKVLCKMGWGQYSTVWLTRDLVSSRLFALKVGVKWGIHRRFSEAPRRTWRRLRMN